MRDLRERAVESEQAIIGSALLNADNVLPAIDTTAKDFLNPNNAAVWQAIIDTDLSGPVDLMTVNHTLEAQTGRSWAAYLSEMCRHTPSSANVKSYAKILRQIRQKSDAIEVCKKALNDIGSDQPDAINAAIAALMSVCSSGRNYEYSIKESLRAAISKIEAVRKGEVSTVPTGVHELDSLLGGLHRSDLVVLAARPAMGKTAVMLNWALKSNAPVGIISSEQPHEQIGIRTLSISSKVPVMRMRAGDLDQAQWSKLTPAAANMVNQGLWINDKSGITIGEIVAQARKWSHLFGIQALYVDYIQRIKPSNPALKKHEQVGEIVQGLKNLARELDIPVVALAQVGRQVEQRADRRPTMGDISDSSEVEKEADQVICIYRDEVYNPETEHKGIIEFLIEKNRHGPTGRKKAFWVADNMTVADIERRHSD